MSNGTVPTASHPQPVAPDIPPAFTDDLLREAANSIPVGFVMFNAQQQIVVANSTFMSLYDLSPDRIGPGTTLADLLKARFGSSGITLEELQNRIKFVEDLVAREEPHARIDTLPSGRRISVVHRPLPGGCWVGTHEDVTEREAAADRLRYLAHHDVLTGLKSRAYFWDALQARAVVAEKDQVAFALHLIDLDGFKQVNDTYGHHAGDMVLKTVAERLQATIRRVDIVARLGGDEFAVVQCHKDLDRARVEALAERMIVEISQEIPLAQGNIRIGASLGIAFVNDFEWDLEALTRAADQAMYAAKRAGKNGYKLAEPGSDQNVRRAG